MRVSTRCYKCECYGECDGCDAQVMYVFWCVSGNAESDVRREQREVHVNMRLAQVNLEGVPGSV